MSSAPTICCRSCHGTGRKRLPRHLAGTLAVITDDWQPTSEIQRLLGGEFTLHKTALCNRLVRLLDEKLVERRDAEYNGKIHEWRRVPKRRATR